MSERKVEKLFVARIGIALMTGGEGQYVFPRFSHSLLLLGRKAIWFENDKASHDQ